MTNKNLILLAAFGDIAMCAQHYVNHIHIPGMPKPVWVVKDSYKSILEELFADYFTIYPVEVPANNPLQAAAMAKKRFPMNETVILQQNGFDQDLEGVRQFPNYQEFQIFQLQAAFQK